MPHESAQPPLQEALPATIEHPAATPLTPITTGERVEVVDILRGLALFGILMVNIHWFSNPAFAVFVGYNPWTDLHDKLAEWFIKFFFEGKFYSLFSLLFGFGFAVQLLRAEARNAPFIGLYARRLLVLMGFGIGHVVFFWNGDILIIYALCGFVLLLMRNIPNRWLITLGITLVLLGVVPVILATGLGKVAMALKEQRSTTAASVTQPSAAPAPATSSAPTTASAAPTDDEDEMPPWLAETYEIYQQGSFFQIMQQRLIEYAAFFVIQIFFVVPSVLGMFLFGLYLGRNGILHNIDAHLDWIKRVMWWSLPIGLVGNLVAVLANEIIGTQTISWWSIPASLLSYAGHAALCFFYVGVVILLTRRDFWKNLLHPISRVGRMALTNYLLQTVICTTIFYSYGLALFGKVGTAWGIVLTIVIYACQIPLSVLWLRHYRFGPLEWLWRSLTYGRKQPMRRVES